VCAAFRGDGCDAGNHKASSGKTSRLEFTVRVDLPPAGSGAAACRGFSGGSSRSNQHSMCVAVPRVLGSFGFGMRSDLTSCVVSGNRGHNPGIRAQCSGTRAGKAGHFPLRAGLGPIRQAQGSVRRLSWGSLPRERAAVQGLMAPLQFVAHGLGDEAAAVASMRRSGHQCLTIMSRSKPFAGGWSAPWTGKKVCRPV